MFFYYLLWTTYEGFVVVGAITHRPLPFYVWSTVAFGGLAIVVHLAKVVQNRFGGRV